MPSCLGGNNNSGIGHGAPRTCFQAKLQGPRQGRDREAGQLLCFCIKPQCKASPTTSHNPLNPRRSLGSWSCSVDGSSQRGRMEAVSVTSELQATGQSVVGKTFPKQTCFLALLPPVAKPCAPSCTAQPRHRDSGSLRPRTGLLSGTLPRTGPHTSNRVKQNLYARPSAPKVLSDLPSASCLRAAAAASAPAAARCPACRNRSTP